MSIEPQRLAGQPQCTAPGTFAAAVDGKIASYDYVGQTTAYGGVTPILYTFRFWHVTIQNQPGQWSWWDSIVAQC